MELKRLDLVLLWLCKDSRLIPLFTRPSGSATPSLTFVPQSLCLVVCSSSGKETGNLMGDRQCSCVLHKLLVSWKHLVQSLFFSGCVASSQMWPILGLGRRICCFKPATSATTEIANFLLMGQISLCYWGSQSIIVSNSVIAIFNPSFRDLWSVF